MTEKTFIPLDLETLIPGMAENPFQRDELAQTSYRPTIVIGIGGTGLVVVRQLKKILRKYYQDREMDIFQFVVFDTAAQEVPEGEEPLSAGEFVHLGAFDAADMIRHLPENPYIASWWPGGADRPYRPTFSGTGANRVRAVGRLVFFNYVSNLIIPRIEAKIDRAIEINAQHGMGATSIKIYIVGSLAGGTGSGMLLDFAYISRMLGLRRQPNAYLTGILVMDDAFLPKAHTEYTRAEFRANTYAALKELNHFASTRHFHVQYDDITTTAELPDGFRPFDITYLLGLHNSEGQALENFESLADMIAAEVMLEIASPLHGRTENVLDNVKATERSIAGQPAAYSSFAVTALVYPLKGIASWCALSSYQDVLQKVFLSPRRPVSDIETDVISFTQKVGVEEEQSDQLIDRLAMNARGEPLIVPSLSHDQVNGLPESQLLGALQRMEELALNDLALAKESLSSNLPAVKRQFREDVRREADVILRDPKRGPQYLHWFLSKLEERLISMRETQMIVEQGMFQTEVAEAESSWRDQLENLTAALRLPGIVPWRHGQINRIRAAYTASFNAYLNATYQFERRSVAVLAYNTFLEEVRSLTQLVSGLIGGWQRLARMAQERASAELIQDRATETEFSLMRNVIGHDQLQTLLKRSMPNLTGADSCDHLAAEFWKYTWEQAPAWTLLRADPPADLQPPVCLYRFLATEFARETGQLSLIERLKEIFGDSWEREVELRFHQTAPFWNYNLARFGDKIRNNLQNEPRLVGYGEPNVQGWTSAVSKIIGELVDGINNKNPHEMVFLTTAHGLPLFALRSMNQTLRSAYDYLQRLWEENTTGSNPIPVHISSAWDKILMDISPVTPAAELHLSMESSQSNSGGNGHRTPEISPEA